MKIKRSLLIHCINKVFHLNMSNLSNEELLDFFNEKTFITNVKVKYIRPSYDNLKEWIKNPNHIYIGRQGVVFINKERFPKKESIWANPFKIGKKSREEVLVEYEVYIRNKIKKENLKDELLSLEGKVLGCWCKPEPCHGDILIKLIKEMKKK